MKKNPLLLFVLSLLLFVSCEKTPEKKVETAFKNYCKENFSSNQSLKEIISIEVIDTVSTQKIIEAVKTLPEYEGESLFRDDDFPTYYGMKNDYRVPYSLREEYCENLLTYIKGMMDQGIKYYSNRMSLDRAIETNDSTTIVQYEIKASVKDNGIIDVKNYYAVVYNYNFEEIKIQDHKLKSDECPEELKTILDLLEEVLGFIEAEEYFHSKVVTSLEKCERYM